ncbi:DNA polymerase zeta processivity subunit-like [Drosophila obscura]|uniref:DNA polymerase zeta processivity subunit-like n=1 Tax=Drosophila obscura TaxID=7282 RepID=UPI001BB1FD05|nr:DNA polymerase zeta processivity subunit-like [Drosophila obscura]
MNATTRSLACRNLRFSRRELKCFEIMLYHSENQLIESYMLQIDQLESGAARQPAEDPHLIEYEQQLRSALYKLSERVKPLPKLPGNSQFKAAETPQHKNAPSAKVCLLPLATVDNVGLKMQASIFG